MLTIPTIVWISALSDRDAADINLQRPKVSSDHNDRNDRQRSLRDNKTGTLKRSLLGTFWLPYLTKYLSKIPQTLTQNAKWAKEDICLVFFLNLLKINVKQRLLLGSKFCDTGRVFEF